MATAAAATLPGPGPGVQLHTIWGNVEGVSTSETSASASGSTPGSKTEKTGNDQERRVRRLPPHVLSYLSQISFNTESGDTPDDDSGKIRSAAASLTSAQDGKGVQEDGNLPGVQEDGNLPEGQDAEEEEEEDDDEAAGSAQPAGNSKGSSLHAAGSCRPCHYVHTSLGCLNGQDCSFCHFSHTKKSRPRPCKTKRVQCQRYARMLDGLGPPDEILDKMVDNKLLQSARGKYLQGLLRKRSEEQKQAQGSDHPPLPVGAVASSSTSGQPSGWTAEGGRHRGKPNIMSL